MTLEYLAADGLARMRAAAAPAGLHSASVSRGVEDAAGFAPLAIRNAATASAGYRTVLACEVVAARRALQQQGRIVHGGLGAALTALDELDRSVADRDLSADLDAAGLLLGALAAVLDE